jgi:hypothetical protein
VKLAETFRADALREIESRVESLRESLTYPTARALPAAEYHDMAIAAREVQLTVFRQVDVPASQQVLVAVQIARFAMGGLASFKLERGLVFSVDGSIRDATAQELASSAT